MSSNRRVTESSAGRSVSAYIIFKRHRHIATIQIGFGSSGGVLVNVFNHGDKNRSAKNLPFQTNTAGGYGYDKVTAALAGLEIDGHKLGNHCQYRKMPPATGVWPRDAVAPKGWRFANYNQEKDGYTDCYREPGLQYLERLGYSVIQAI